jgi:hypothetical protein
MVNFITNEQQWVCPIAVLLNTLLMCLRLTNGRLTATSCKCSRPCKQLLYKVGEVYPAHQLHVTFEHNLSMPACITDGMNLNKDNQAEESHRV